MEGSEALPDFQDKNFIEPLTNIDINTTNIAKAIDKLKASKSQGHDQIHPKLLKECKESLLEPLEIIFKKSVDNSQNTLHLEAGQCNSYFQKREKN